MQNLCLWIDESYNSWSEKKKKENSLGNIVCLKKKICGLYKNIRTKPVGVPEQTSFSLWIGKAQTSEMECL